MLFDEPTLHKLNQLTLLAHKIHKGLFKGDRKSSRHGNSIEFADYRNYTPGDDLRHLDWNVYARLDRPFLKLMQEEEDLAVNVLVDCSASMDWGEGATHKLKYSIHLAAAIAAIALGAGDKVAIHLVKNGAENTKIGPLRGAFQLSRVLLFLENFPVQPGGITNLDEVLRNMSLAIGRPGLAFLVSDLFSPHGFYKGMNAFLARGFEFTILHTLCPTELDPPLAGDLRLVDIETGDSEDISIDGGMRELYRRRLLQWQTGIEQESRKRNSGYLLIDTSIPWEKLVLFEMRREGFVK